MRSCYICTSEKELRPYGPKGEDVCFQCAFSTPERKKQTEQSFELQVDACGELPVIGLNVGPTTFESIKPLLRHKALRGEEKKDGD